MATQQEKLQRQKEEVEIKRPKGTVYRVNEAGEIEELAPPLNAQDMVRQGYGGKATREAFYSVGWGGSKEYKELVDKFNKDKKNYPYKTLREAANEASKITRQSVSDIEKRYKDSLSLNQTYNTIADQIRGLTGGGMAGAGRGDMLFAGGTPYFDERTGQYVGGAPGGAASAFSADRAFGSSDLANRLNFQVSDQQIIDDYNQSRIGRLNRISQDGQAQIVGIQNRLQAAKQLIAGLPANDPRRVAAQVSIDQLNSDLESVQGAVAKATDQIKNYVPVTPDSQEGLRQITSFREFIKLPEERAGEQLRQIDPEAYRTAVGLGRQYRRMATEPLGATTTPQTEQLRQTIEQEALNQLRLGSTLGAEERRGYEQAVRAAQTARGNIFGLGPAVQEAAQLGAAGEQRKLARYGAAQQFLASGETTGAAAARDLALREGLVQQRLGAASGFLAGGPSLANLAQQRLGQQNLAAQQYVQANQALPGQFQTAGMPQQFYQTANPAIPVQLASNAANVYGSMADYQAQTYGAQVGAIARQPSGAEIFGQIATGLSNLIKI